MGYKFYDTGTVALAAGNNTLVTAPNPLSDGLGLREIFARKLTAQRVGTNDVTIIVKNGSGRELEQRWNLTAEMPALYLQFNDTEEIGVGGGEPLLINASNTGVNVRVEYRTGSAIAWPT